MAATSVLKLVVDDKEYSASLKNAKQGMQALQDSLQNTGKTFLDVDKRVVEYARALGQMETTSKSARGKIGEMSSAFVELSIQYKHLTDQEKQSPLGKAMSESLDTLKTRVIDAKQELADFENQLKDIGDAKINAAGGGLFGGLGDKVSGALQVFAGNMLTKAAGAALDFAGDIGECVKQGIELARQGEGIRIAFERLNQPGLLNNLREATHGTVTDLELMKAAVKFNDFKLPVEELGTMLAFAQQKAKDTGQSVDYMVDSIVTGLGRKSLMILDNLGLSASEVKERMKETGDMTKAVGDIIREQMAKAGDYVETAADRATKANVDLQNAMTRLGETFQPLSDAGTSLWSDLKIGALDLLNNAVRPLIDALTEAGRIRSQYAEQGGDSRVNRQLERLRGISTMQYRRNTYSAQLSNYDSKIGSYEQYLSDYKKWQGDKTAVGAYDRMQAFQKQTGLSMYSDVKEQLEVFKKMRSEYVMGAKSIIADNPAPSPATPTDGKKGGSGKNTTKVPTSGDFEKFLNKSTFNVEKLKPEEYIEVPSVWEQYGKKIAKSMDESSKIISESMIGVNDAMNNLSIDNFMDSYDAVEKRIADLNKNLKEQKAAYSLAGQAAQNFGAALMNIEDPAAKAAGTVMQAVASIALGFSMASANANTAGTGWGWLAWLAAGTAAMATTIGTIHSLTGYAQGGMIKGNSYSGDNVGGLVDGSQLVGLNAGEIVLNAAGQQNVAANLRGGALGGMSLKTKVHGTELLIWMDNALAQSGRGEMVTWGT